MLIMADRKEGILSKKLGRPTDNPKSTRITVRLDDTTLEILDKYCKKEDVKRVEGIRRGIRKLGE